MASWTIRVTQVQKKMGDFFGLQPQSRGTRFNWYNNPSDWKPFHHDSAAFNAQRARNQNCTVGVSFGDARELAFVDALDPSKRFYFPQTNGGLFYFGRDVNIRSSRRVEIQPSMASEIRCPRRLQARRQPLAGGGALGQGPRLDHPVGPGRCD